MYGTRSTEIPSMTNFKTHTMSWLLIKYCKTANFHVLVILTNSTNEKNSLKLQLVKVSSINYQK